MCNEMSKNREQSTCQVTPLAGCTQVCLLLRPRLHSTQTVSTLLSPTHYWALLWQEDLTVDPSHIWNLGSQEWAVQRPSGEWLLQGLRCWMSCLSLHCWPMPMTLIYASEFSTRCQVEDNHPWSNSYLVLYRCGPCVRRSAFIHSIWQTLFCRPEWHHHPAAMAHTFCPSYFGLLKQRTRHYFPSAVRVSHSGTVRCSVLCEMIK